MICRSFAFYKRFRVITTLQYFRYFFYRYLEYSNSFSVKLIPADYARYHLSSFPFFLSSFGFYQRNYSISVGLKWNPELFQMHLGNIHLHIHVLIQKYYSGNFLCGNCFESTSRYPVKLKGPMTTSSSDCFFSKKILQLYFNPVICHLLLGLKT
jgi:hypothetical protein